VNARALALLAVLVPVACAAMARPADTPRGVDAPALRFTVWPRDLTEGTAGRGYEASVVFLPEMRAFDRTRAFYRVSVLGVGGDRIIAVPTDLAVDAQLRVLRTVADDAARELMSLARLSCDSLRPRKPPRGYGQVCA